MFRLEAVQHSRAGSHGTVILARPLSHAWLTWMFAAIAALLVSFFMTAGVTRSAQVRGVLMPARGLIRVLTDEPLRKRLRSKGRFRAASFRWDGFAAEHLAIYRDLAGRS